LYERALNLSDVHRRIHAVADVHAQVDANHLRLSSLCRRACGAPDDRPSNSRLRPQRTPPRIHNSENSSPFDGGRNCNQSVACP
jgi:hypothetical protein